MSEQTIWQGESVTLRFQVTGEDRPSNVTPHARIAHKPGEDAIVKVEGSAITTDGDDYLVDLTPEQTKKLPTGSVYVELYEVSNGVRAVIYPKRDDRRTRLRVAPSQLASHDPEADE